jgi:hypothetical protein
LSSVQFFSACHPAHCQKSSACHFLIFISAYRRPLCPHNSAHLHLHFMFSSLPVVVLPTCSDSSTCSHLLLRLFFFKV